MTTIPQSTSNAKASQFLTRPTGLDVSLCQDAETALADAVDFLVAEQHPDGHWCAELEGDSILQSEYILLQWIVELETEEDVGEKVRKVANYLRGQQRPEDGAWVQYPGAKADLAATVKAYFALKLAGDSPDMPHMVKARELVLKLGGAEKVDTFAAFYLAQLGQIHFDNVPVIPPEIVMLPRWFFFHVDKISAWSRTMVMPLAVLSHFRRVRDLPQNLGISELFVDESHIRKHRWTWDKRAISWKNFFLAADRAIKLWEKTRVLPMRKRSLRKIEEWLVERVQRERTDGLGAIFPSMVYLQVVLKCLGYADDDPLVIDARHQLERFMIEENDTIRLQPCFSPVWDSGIAAYALTDAGFDWHDSAAKGVADWLVKQECRMVGDWKNNIPGDHEPAGWCFEYNNEYYPDVDDTVMVAMALKRIGGEEALAAARRGVEWVLKMQNGDGGWAAFDRTKDRPILEKIPFADHNAIQDPSCADITGRTLECLSYFGYKTSDPVVQNAINFLKRTQEPEGCWFGRWGVNYIYGTWQAVCGLRRLGVDMTEDWVMKAGLWLKSIQRPDGSFGESADSYEFPSLKGNGNPTASQTSWATMALMAIYGREDRSVKRGIAWLVKTQNTDGDWTETEFTGTGFPKVFYLRYHYYRLYFPIMCIGRWLNSENDSDS